jgi:hypothetical protein
MEILDFIDLSIKMENRISALYEIAAEKAAFSHPQFVPQLKTLAREEIGHVNVLRMGRNYAGEMPDLFSRTAVDVGDIQAGLKESERIADVLSAEKDLRSLLMNLLELEKSFEKLHLTASVLIKDESLKSLFASLSKGDHNHILAMGDFLKSF